MLNADYVRTCVERYSPHCQPLPNPTLNNNDVPASTSTHLQITNSHSMYKFMHNVDWCVYLHLKYI